MATITLLDSPTAKKIRVEIDADKLERLAASLGFFNPDFVESLERAEKDYKAGRVRRVRSLKGLRGQSAK